MNRIAVAKLTSEAFAPFSEVGASLADGGDAPVDVALDLTRGTPDGEPRLMAVVPANLVQPGLADIRAFCIPPGCCIKLRLGTPQAGPYFTGPVSDFYNLEMVDTNIADYTVWRPHAPLEFAT
jgi:hypothetical protein